MEQTQRGATTSRPHAPAAAHALTAAWVAAFAHGGTTILGTTAGTSLFLMHFRSLWFPIGYAVSGVLVSLLASAFVRKDFSSRSSVFVSILLLAVRAVPALLVLVWDHPISAFVLLLANGPAVAFSRFRFSTLLDTGLDLRRAKARFPIVMTGAVASALIFGVAFPLVAPVGPIFLAILTIPFEIASLIVVLRAGKKRPAADGVQDALRFLPLRRAETPKAYLGAVHAIAWVVTAVAITSEASFVSGVEQLFGGVGSSTQFVSLFYGIAYGVEALLAISIGPRLLRKRGAAGAHEWAALAVGAVAIMGIVIGGSGMGAVIAAVAVRLVERVLNSSVTSPAYYALFLVIPPEQRNTARAKAELLGRQRAGAVTGVLLLAATQTGLPFGRLLVLVVLAGAWFVGSKLLRRTYAASVRALYSTVQIRRPRTEANVPSDPAEEIGLEKAVFTVACAIAARRARTSSRGPVPDDPDDTPGADTGGSDPCGLLDAAIAQQYDRGRRMIAESLARNHQSDLLRELGQDILGKDPGRAAVAAEQLEVLLSHSERRYALPALVGEMLRTPPPRTVGGMTVPRFTADGPLGRARTIANCDTWPDAWTHALARQLVNDPTAWSLRRLCALRSSPALRDVPDDILTALADSCAERAFAKDEVIIREGERGTGLFALLSGGAHVTRGEALLAEVHAPAVVGELAAIVPEPRSATVRATDDVRAIEVTHAALGALIGTHSIVGRAIGREVGHRVRRTIGDSRPGLAVEQTGTPQEASETEVRNRVRHLRAGGFGAALPIDLLEVLARNIVPVRVLLESDGGEPIHSAGIVVLGAGSLTMVAEGRRIASFLLGDAVGTIEYLVEGPIGIDYRLIPPVAGFLIPRLIVAELLEPTRAFGTLCAEHPVRVLQASVGLQHATTDPPPVAAPSDDR